MQETEEVYDPEYTKYYFYSVDDYINMWIHMYNMPNMKRSATKETTTFPQPAN